jgi:DNA-binding NarL/FixJ family response regulator
MANGADLSLHTGAFRDPATDVVRALIAHRHERTVLQPLGSRVFPSDRVALTQAAVEAQHALREAAAAAATAAAHARSMAAMLDETLAVLVEAETTSAEAAPRRIVAAPATVALSPREKEVLALVAEGCSNKAIAEALFVSPNTVKTHVASLLSKLHADSRVQLAALAARQARG